MIGEEDRKMAEGWTEDSYICEFLSALYFTQLNGHRLVYFRGRGDIDLSINPIYSTKLARRPHVLCRKHLSGSC